MKTVQKHDDRELRKLNRLEILELLLEQTRLNEQLRDENDELREINRKLMNEKSADDTVASLEEVSGQLNAALEYVESITKNLQNIPVGAVSCDAKEVVIEVPAEPEYESEAQDEPFDEIKSENTKTEHETSVNRNHTAAILENEALWAKLRGILNA